MIRDREGDHSGRFTSLMADCLPLEGAASCGRHDNDGIGVDRRSELGRASRECLGPVQIWAEFPDR